MGVYQRRRLGEKHSQLNEYVRASWHLVWFTLFTYFTLDLSNDFLAVGLVYAGACLAIGVLKEIYNG